MIVVSDTTPLISLMKLARLSLLEDLFGEVSIPETVYRELTENQKFLEEAEMVRQSSFLKRVEVEEQKAVEVLQRVSGLDLGEKGSGETMVVLAAPPYSVPQNPSVVRSRK